MAVTNSKKVKATSAARVLCQTSAASATTSSGEISWSPIRMRSVKRRSVTSQAKYAVEHRRSRAFAVGPSDVKRRKSFFRMVEERERPFHAV